MILYPPLDDDILKILLWKAVTVFSLRIPKEGGCNIDKSVTGTQSNSVWTESTHKAWADHTKIQSGKNWFGQFCLLSGSPKIPLYVIWYETKQK